jgi:hypothetical protein
LPSLRQCVLVAQDRQAVDVLTCEAHQRWAVTLYDAADQNTVFQPIDCAVLMSEIYDNVELDNDD